MVDPELLVERVLRAVELVPTGQVASYGDIGSVCGVGPRQVGRVMSQWGSDVAWWRITNAAGDLPAALRTSAFAHWRDEGIAVKPNGLGCRIANHRTDLADLAVRWQAAIADLPPVG